MYPASKAVHFTATGDIVATADGGTTKITIHGLVLTPAAAAATAVIRENGSGGTIRMSLQAAASGGSVIVNVPFQIADPHVTLGGAGVLFTALI
jgi:hypothetical protein